MTVEELQVLVTANTESLRKEINNVSKNFTKMQTSANKTSNNMLKSFNSLKRGVIALGIGKLIASQLDDAVSRVDTLNNFPKVMSNLGIGNEEAQASLSRLNDALIGLPTTLDDASTSVQRFTSANGNVKASTEMFLALNNAILSGGASTEIQKTAMEQLSQAYAKGKPDMMEWRSAMTSMPAQLKQVALAMGYVSADQLGESLRNGTVSMDEFMAKLVELNKNGANGFQSFEEQARNSTGGIGTSMTNVKTAFTRGMAEIMNAIGQSNIAGFFQSIARVINAVVPYITGFVKACVWAINSISGLFGKSSVSKSINSTSTAMSNLGSSSTSTASDLDSATGSAKKLKKELNGLASFDEMNVLKEADSSDSGSSGSGGSSGVGGGDLSGIDLSAFDTALETTNSKADEIAKHIQDIFSEIGSGIDFNNVISAFQNMGGAIEFFISGSANLLKDWWSNFFVPMTQYQIGEFLPSFLNATADAIKSINFEKIQGAFNELWKVLVPFEKNIGNGLLWFYSEVLLPLGVWTINDVLPAFLNIFSGALAMLNQAITDIQPIFDWLWNSVLSPIAEWTGGVIVDTLTAMGDALKWISENEIAMAIIEGIATAIGLVAGALAIYNIAMGICNVVTGIFSGIMAVLTSPITLVVAVIGALIAVIILCVNHWEEIGNAAAACWDWIVSIWNSVASWFNDTIIQPIANFFKGLWEGIKIVFSAVVNFFKGVFQGAWDSIKAVFSGVGNFFSGVWTGIKNVFSGIGNWFRGIFQGAVDIIKNIWDGLVNIVKTPINWLIDGLNAFIGMLNNIKVPDWVPAIGGKGINIPKIPKLARGGIVDRPMTAVIGEAGKEAVMPLENNTGWIDNLAHKLSSVMGNTSNGDTPIQLVVRLGEDTIFEKFIDYSKEKSFETNGEVLYI